MRQTLSILLSLAAVSLFAAAKDDGAKAPVAAMGKEQKASVDDAAADKLLLAARDAYVHGHYATAIAIAKQAIKARPNQAWRLIGASSCFLKDRNGALLAWNQLDSQGRSFLTYVCSRNAITIP